MRSRKRLSLISGAALAGIVSGVVCAQTVLLEDFESGNLDDWTVATGNPQAYVTSAAAYTGNYGVAFFQQTPAGWYVNEQISTSAGNVYTGFVRTVNPNANDGRVYLAVDAGVTQGGISATFAPNTGQLLLQDVSGWSFSTIASVSVNIDPDTWYQLDLNWVGPGQAQARLWDETRTTLLADTGVHNVSMVGGGGLAFRGFGNDVNHLDDIWQNIPAPGALALLGLAGLIGRSRRRN